MPAKGQKMPPEVRAQISAKMKGHFKSEATRVKMSEAKTGVKRNYRSYKWRENISAALKGKKRPPMSAEAKAKLSDWMKQRWQWIKATEAAENERQGQEGVRVHPAEEEGNIGG